MHAIASSDRVVTIKQKFKLAVAAILDFWKVKSEGKIVSGTLCPCSKFGANMCSSDRDVANKLNFKMAATAILDWR